MKIGFIGCGNMAKAIINGIIRQGVYSPDAIFASAKDYDKLQSFCAKNGIHACKSNADVCMKSDIILLAVKPQQFPDILPIIAPFCEHKLIISIAAGKTIETISSLMRSQRIIRVMPNLNAQISQSVSAVSAHPACDPADLKQSIKIFECVGKVFEIAEQDFSAFSAIACCSPAFTFMYISALAQAGIRLGLDEKTAYEAATHAVSGSANLLSCSDQSAQRLIERVCSPGGTTIEGVTKLRQNEFDKLIAAAVEASFKKDKLL